MAPRTPVVISPVPVFPIVILSLILYLSGSSVLASMANVLTTTQQFGFIASTFSSRNFIESILFSGSAGTFLGSFFWGVFSDTFGRKRSLLISLFSSLVFILIRVFHRIDMAWLPFYTFCASICNGSLVIVKAYAGDILDATNATEGITALGVCTIFINAIFLGIDSILNKIAIYTRNMQWILVIPTLLETIALLCVIACVQLYFHETIRVKWKSDLQNNNDGIQTMQIASSTDAPSFKKDFLNTVNTQLISFYRKLSNTTDDEEDEDTDKKREAAKIVEMYGKKSNDSNSVSSSAASGEIWSTGNGVSATRDKVSSEELFAKEEDRYATVMLEGVSVYAPAVINNNTKYNSITLAEDQEYIRTNSSGSTNSDNSDDFFFGGVSTDTPPPPPPPRKVYSPTPNQIGVLKDGRSRAVRLRPNSMSRSSPPLSRRYSNSPIPEEKGNHVLTRSAMSVGPGTRYIPNSSNVSIVCPTSPIRRNVSFNGITTVKVIGNDSLAVGKLKLLNQNETPLNTGPGVFPNVSGSSAGTGLDSGSSNVSSQLITLQEEGESELEDRRSPTDSVVPDSAKSTTHRISPTPIKASNKESSCVILPQNVESETTGIVTLDTINDESTLNNDSESDPLLKEERDVPVETNASSPSDTDTESSVVTASSRSESENIAAAAQDLITTMSTSRYCNGANEYVTQLESISPMGVLLKTLKSLTSRNTVVYSVILYTINMCIITAVSICTPLWLLQHSESDQTSDSERKMETLVKYNVSNSSMLSSTISSMESIIEVLPEAEVIMETVVDAEGVGGMGNYYKQPTASPTAMVAASQWDPINNPR